MISNQILQNTIDGVKEISHLDLAVMDSDGRDVVCTAQIFDEIHPAVAGFVESEADTQQSGNYYLFKVFDGRELTYILAVYGDADTAILTGRMCAFQLKGLLSALGDHFSRDGYIKNLILDNLLLVDIYEGAKKLHIPPQRRRVVLLIEFDSRNYRESEVSEVMQNFEGIRPTDFVTGVNEKNVLYVLDLADSGGDSSFIHGTGEAILAHLAENGLPDCRIASGLPVFDIKDLSKSYKEATMALDVAKIFFEERKIIAYNQLGIGRLIYQLPIPLCRIYIQEIFGDIDPDEFDKETVATIDKFFENNLNVSETSRQLFIHRNTLVYRLDKLQKSTGLDLRRFDDAITFKIALMVVRYMKFVEEREKEKNQQPGT